MSKTAYRRTHSYVSDLAVCARHMSDQYEIGLSPRRRALIRAMRACVTPRQLQCLTLYYGQKLNQREIGRKLGIHVSTVSRNIKRGEANLNALLELEATLQ